MRYIALATDYDGTIATQGKVGPDVVEALRRFAASGRHLILVTGRDLDDLIRVFPEIDIFERVVAENGALLYRPRTKEEKVLTEPPNQTLVATLKARCVENLQVGRSIIATWTPHETTCLEAIKELGLELQVIFNKGAVMILPSSVNKATGLKAALKEIGLSQHNTVGVGDAENDHSFMSLCEVSAAVCNALPMVKEHADLTMTRDHGPGVVELIERILYNDLSDLSEQVSRHDILIGRDESGQNVVFKPHCGGLLIAGPSGSGKSSLTLGVLERLAEARYQFCLIDPEGDYDALEHAIVVGGPGKRITVEDVLHALAEPKMNVVVNLLGVKLADRPGFFASLLPRLQEMRTKTARPHWIIVDEAHHMIHARWEHAAQMVPAALHNVILITVHPDEISPLVLSQLDYLVAVGEQPCETLKSYARAAKEPMPPGGDVVLTSSQALVWRVKKDSLPVVVNVAQARCEHTRHIRKYAEGDLFDHSFYFKGPRNKLNLKAQNLSIFNQMAQGVDRDTWMHHLKNHHYSEWFRHAIKDDELAEAAYKIESDKKLSSDESRAAITGEIEKRYTAPARAISSS